MTVSQQLHEMPTIETSHDWMNTPKKQDEITQLNYEVERLQREVQLHKDSLVNYQNNVSLYTKDYARLEVDFKNSEYENRILREQLDKHQDTGKMNIMLMKQVIELQEQMNIVEGDIK